ncbi:hypothetical protein ElyMa_004026400 [Elysia marginata]|uniref:ABC transmembrane type-1 domain-containing protein n=1 Tax=Elysia marginata TaxID=1093978 RepID=A0AAV4G525_9GAST|nr:hypothetical protein ElyMa_004026400 [Elysia marginata]
MSPLRTLRSFTVAVVVVIVAMVVVVAVIAVVSEVVVVVVAVVIVIVVVVIVVVVVVVVVVVIVVGIVVGIASAVVKKGNCNTNTVVVKWHCSFMSLFEIVDLGCGSAVYTLSYSDSLLNVGL